MTFANQWLTRSLALALVEELPDAPSEPHSRSEWVRGFLDGFRDFDYQEVVDETDPTFVVPSDNPYRKGYYVGKFSRTCRN